MGPLWELRKNIVFTEANKISSFCKSTETKLSQGENITELLVVVYIFRSLFFYITMGANEQAKI